MRHRPHFVWQSPRLWLPRDAPESDPVSNRRFVDVLQPLRVAKLAGPCDCGLYCSLAEDELKTPDEATRLSPTPYVPDPSSCTWLDSLEVAQPPLRPAIVKPRMSSDLIGRVPVLAFLF
jgi:hypothetical protein